MLWVVLIVIIVIVGLAVPRFGKALLICVGVLVGLVLIWYFNHLQEEEASKKRIAANELDLIELRLLPQTYSAESFELVGRIRNKSGRYTLTDLRLRITMKDCLAANQCETVGESSAWLFQSVPPGQSREIKESVYFSHLGRPGGKFEWGYIIEQISGK
ncbi:MAG: hypothetical protein HY735_37915 [Verrucomicrobia bacterium]|nr:hypothetical protein [Verrucomicrobiota bacterium]